MPAKISSLPRLALLLLTAACVTPGPLPSNGAVGGSPSLSLFSDSLETWTKPGLDTRRFTVEEHQCYLAAVNMPPTPDLIVGGVVDLARIFAESARTSQTYYACMARLGYRRA